MPPTHQQFTSDNCSGICPEALAALLEANAGHDRSYGDDRWTAEACELFRALFDADCQVYFVLTGTAGNALALASAASSYHSIICHRVAHVEVDECGAPEFFSHGAKILLADGEDGKLTPKGIREIATRRADIHYPKPRAVSVTQSTEAGTVYSPADLLALRTACRDHGLALHMDGARFANAVASLGCAPRAITADCGVDVLVFGGSKNGLSIGEAVVFFNPAMADEFDYRCKQAGQLLSKMRFVASQWVGVLRDGAWLRHARHANDCAAELDRQLRAIPQATVLFPRQANGVFVRLPPPTIAEMNRRGWRFSDTFGPGTIRLMCSWDTTPETIAAFITDLKAALEA
ncbi:MAG: threonine aldolase [Candidatus Sumerlaeota bacterium]|nr:threonine aldolase [Candidatus Sumerlaeota bacterium]